MPWSAWVRPYGTSDPLREGGLTPHRSPPARSTDLVHHGGWWYPFASTVTCCAGPTTGYSVQVGCSRPAPAPATRTRAGPEWTVNDLSAPPADVSSTDDDAGVLLRSAPGRRALDGADEVSIDLGVDTIRSFSQAGLVAHVDDDEFTRLFAVTVSDTRQTEFGHEIPYAGRLSYGGTIVGPAATPWLRLTHRLDPRNGQHGLRALTSRAAGTPALVHWTSVRRRAGPARGRARVGLLGAGGGGGRGLGGCTTRVGHGDLGHDLRVARAAGPLGPFTDTGVNPTPEESFAIDPHPFRDADGTW